MIVSVALFAQVWASCVGQTVAVETGAAVARAESGFNTLAIHDNTTGRSYTPRSLTEAVAVATALRAAGNSLDLGLMQVNSANLARLGLTIASAFDPCRNVAAGAQVLVDDYLAGHPNQDVQLRLRQALSRYNTGDSAAGFVNGYVSRVQAAAGQIVPAIRLEGTGMNGASAVAQQPGDPQPGAHAASLIDGLVHPDTHAADTAITPGNSDDALIHAGEASPPSESPSAPPPSQASPRPSG
jgi:type IV secretion system protein VirB1